VKDTIKRHKTCGSSHKASMLWLYPKWSWYNLVTAKND